MSPPSPRWSTSGTTATGSGFRRPFSITRSRPGRSVMKIRPSGAKANAQGISSFCATTSTRKPKPLAVRYTVAGSTSVWVQAGVKRVSKKMKNRVPLPLKERIRVRGRAATAQPRKALTPTRSHSAGAGEAKGGAIVSIPSGRLTEFTEECPDLLDQQVRFFQSGEMTACGHLRPALDVVGPFGPFARRPSQFPGKSRYPRGHSNLFISAQAPGGVAFLVIQPGGRVNGLGDPVQHHVREELVLGVGPFEVALAVTPGAKFFDDPGAQPDRRVIQAISQGLGFGALDSLVPGLLLPPCLHLFEPRLFCHRQVLAILRVGSDTHHVEVNTDKVLRIGEPQP